MAFGDLFALVLILAGITRGLVLGVKRGFISFVGVLLSYTLSLVLARHLEAPFDRLFQLEGGGLFAAYLFLLVVLTALSWGFSWALTSRRPEREIPVTQRWAGAVMGLFEGLVYLLSVVGLFLFQPWFSVGVPFFSRSILFRLVAELVPFYTRWTL